MKKAIMAAVCALIVCFASCANMNGPSQSAAGGQDYSKLNDMLGLGYSGFVLTVTNKFDQTAELTSEYRVMFDGDLATVEYTVERFTSVSGLTGLESQKTVLSGSAAIEDGEVKEMKGDKIELPSNIDGKGFDFKAQYFENAEFTSIYLRAKVKDIKGFFGVDISGSNMIVEATFLDVFFDITVDYFSADGCEVEYKYSFTFDQAMTV